MLNPTKILEFMAENALSKTQFCKLCGISAGTLNKMLGGNSKIQISIIVKIVKLLDISVCDLWADA